MNLTQKQKVQLALILKANSDGPIDFDQLLDRLNYRTSKESLQFSVRALVKKGLAEKGILELRRGRSRRLIHITPLGEHWANILALKAPAANIDELLSEDDLKLMEESLHMDIEPPIGFIKSLEE